jgi:DNA-binding transcriptional LysR family regulator
MGATEYSMATVVSGLLRRIQATAPRSLVRFLPVGPATLDALEAGELDLTFWPFEAPEEPFVSVDLFWEHLVGVVCARHPIARLAAEGAVPLDAYVAYPHILLAPGSPGPNPVDRSLAESGLSRRVAFTTAQFSTVWALRGTDLVMNVPSRLAALSQDHGLAAFPLPVQVPAFACRLVWHRRSEGDPGLTWLRDLVRSELTTHEESPL